ncbi:4,5-DOPA dioxygenase extradiol [Maribellus sp. YY47]|uniref:4,5-DOPA-extradiol-dioxygenase n=1 Tax=Maribellus sp. YY47 TaxID=2929486 RepID=UPI002001C8A4|nr:4,5-DOPA dioxygenase extradiol [Maribellus sp. YY47]MCK3685095.1 4,5-DOPA dioxygenase extradiol [Maribellus sp. YY47]
MERKQFIQTVMATVPLTFAGMKLNALHKIADSLENTPKMPVLFLGHGSPMNAIEENEFVQGFRKISSEIEKPKAIVVVSAHWETQGTRVTAMAHPPTIHDFGGFPKALYEIEYPAPGSPELARATQDLVHSTEVHLDDKWGLDHGAWSVIRHMYPDADIPVIQLSLDYRKSPQEHYALAQELSQLREKGILVVGSGNIVHNLRMIHWGKMNENFGFDWANEANNKMKELILNGDHQQLINYSKLGSAFTLAIPTPEHYLPLLYALGLHDKKDEINIFNDEPIGGSLTMTSVKIG